MKNLPYVQPYGGHPSYVPIEAQRDSDLFNPTKIGKMRTGTHLVFFLLLSACAVTDRRDLLAEGGLRVKLTPNEGATISALQIYSRGEVAIVQGLVKTGGEGKVVGRVELSLPKAGKVVSSACYAPMKRTAISGQGKHLGFFRLILKEVPPPGTLIEIKPLPLDKGCTS